MRRGPPPSDGATGAATATAWNDKPVTTVRRRRPGQADRLPLRTPAPALTDRSATRSAVVRASIRWPGWPYSIVAALETGRTSWTAVPDAVRLEPGADVAAVTTVQIREVIGRLVDVGQWQPGDPEVLVVMDAGYDAPRITHLLDGLPVQVLGRLRSDRVMRRPTPPRVYDPKGGRPPKHGGEFVFGDPATPGALSRP